jgi:hypothetical protein
VLASHTGKKNTKNSQFLRAGEAVGLAVPGFLNRRPFQNITPFVPEESICDRKAAQCDRTPSSDVHQYDLSMHLTPCLFL